MSDAQGTKYNNFVPSSSSNEKIPWIFEEIVELLADEEISKGKEHCAEIDSNAKDSLLSTALYGIEDDDNDEYEKIEKDYRNRMEGLVKLHEKVQVKVTESVSFYFDEKLKALEQEHRDRLKNLAGAECCAIENATEICKSFEEENKNEEAVGDVEANVQNEVTSTFRAYSFVREFASSFVDSFTNESINSVASLFTPSVRLVKMNSMEISQAKKSKEYNLKRLCGSISKKSISDAVLCVEELKNINEKRKQDTIIDIKLAERRLQAQKRVLEHKKHMKLLKEQEDEARKQKLMEDQNRRKKKALDAAQKELKETAIMSKV